MNVLVLLLNQVKKLAEYERSCVAIESSKKISRV